MAVGSSGMGCEVEPFCPPVFFPLPYALIVSHRVQLFEVIVRMVLMFCLYNTTVGGWGVVLLALGEGAFGASPDAGCFSFQELWVTSW